MSPLTFRGNWVDLAIIGFLIIYIAIRLNKGFIESLFDLAGFIVSMVAARFFFRQGAAIILHLIHIQTGFANAIGFFIIATVTEVVLSVFIYFIERFIPSWIHNAQLNRVLGLIPSFFSGLILVLFFVIAIVALPVRPDLKQAVVQSKIGSLLTKNTFGIDTDINTVFGGAVKEALKFMTVEPQSNESVNLHFTTSNFSVDTSSELTMLQLLNKERTTRGLNALQSDIDLKEVARDHCEDMFRRGYFSHYTPDGLSPFDRMKNAGILYTAAGENLAYAPNVQVAHQGLMNSPGHRANILSKDFGRVGIGVIEAGVYGRMFCQEFTN